MPDINALFHEYPSPAMNYLGIRLERTLSKESLGSELSYVSTSTMTMTDNPGPGRVMDKFIFQRGGRAAERYIGRIAYAIGMGPAAVAQRIGNHLQGFSLEVSQKRSIPDVEDETGLVELRLDMGLVQDVDRLRTDCTKLFLYTLSGSILRRIQALRLIIILFIRFPYLRYYFDSPVIIKHLYSAQTEACKPQLRDTTEETILAELSRMAYSCLLPEDITVARFVDHLAERMKYAESHRRGAQSTGPYSGHLPEPNLIRDYCMNTKTSFAALRFTATLFHHFFLTCGPTFYVKLNIYTSYFWESMVEIAKHNMLILSDVEGTELFVFTILQMLYCAISWHKDFEPGTGESKIVESVLCLLRSGPMSLILPQSAHFAISVFEPRWEIVKCDYLIKVRDGRFDTLISKLQDEDSLIKSNPVNDDDLSFDRTRCGPRCKSASLKAFRSCENCSKFLAFEAAQPESDF